MISLKVIQFITGVILLSLFSVAYGEDDRKYRCNKLYQYDASTKGTISSPAYGERNYVPHLWCEYLITAPEGYRIKITFKDLDIYPSGGCHYDRLTISDKSRENNLGVFCGTKLPYPLISKEGQNVVKLILETRAVGTGRGFLLEYESSPYFTSVCENGYSQCTNRNCYQSQQKCNGVDDCGDGSDEEDCGVPIDTFPQECGLQEILPKKFSDGDRIVGGDEAVPHSWPWQVSLRTPYSETVGHHFCGGSLINAQWVLTATHCVASYVSPGEMLIHLGSHDLFDKSEYEQVRRSKKIIAYPDLEGYNILKYNRSHDMALIQLNAPVKFNKGVQPACLPTAGFKAEPGWNCYVTGWGITKGSGFSGLLKQLEQTVNAKSSCSFNEELEICVSKNSMSACHGDSGGPMNCKLGNKYHVFGAASYIRPGNFMGGICAGPLTQSFYTNIPKKVDWIKSIVNKYS